MSFELFLALEVFLHRKGGGGAIPYGGRDLPQELLAAIAGIAALAIENVQRLEQLEGENRRLRDDISIEHNMVGESPLLQRVYQ